MSLTVVCGFVFQPKSVIPAANIGSKNNLLTSSALYAEESSQQQKPTIAIIGSGAVGCYYGTRLWETQKYNLKFHMRGDHFTASRKHGLNVTSVNGDMFIPSDQLQAYEKTEEIGHVDWVIVALKSTAIEATRSLLPPLLRENTRVICIMNGLVDDDIVRFIEGDDDEDGDQNNEEPRLTKCAGVFAGMALLCSNRIAPGHIDHSYAGKLTVSLAKSSSSNSGDNAKEHQEAIEDLWAPTQGFEFVYDKNYVRARWSKNIWNLPFNGISVAMGGITVDKIVTDPGLRQLAYTIMDETIAVANKDLEVRGYSKIDFLGETEVRVIYIMKNTLIICMFIKNDTI
jgi:2-dehydropantoate 2-reductase